jgi:HK97 family phage major capsid protein
MASEVAKRLRDRRLNVWNEARGLAEKAAEENRAFDAEEQGTWEALNSELDELDKRIKSVLDTEQRSRDADAAFDRLSGQGRQAQAQGAAGQAVQQATGRANDELRAMVNREAGAPGYVEIAPTDLVRRLGQQNRIAELRTLSTLTTGAGGNLAPTDFYDTLIAHLIEVSGIMQAGPTVLNTAGGETLQIPKTTSHSLAASAAQAGTIGTSDPAFGLVTLSAYKYGILIQVARELIDDSGVDLLGYLAMQAGRAIGNKFGSDLVTGVGSTQPNGLMNLVTVGVTGTTTGKSGAPQYSDMVNLEYSVIAPYRQSKSCYWIAADKTIGGFRLLTDANSRPIWEPSMVLGSPDLLLGKPIVADPFMAATATGAQSVCFGDFSTFFVRLVGGVRFERSDDYLFNQDLVAFRCLLRGDGTLVDQTGSIKSYKGPAT